MLGSLRAMRERASNRARVIVRARRRVRAALRIEATFSNRRMM